jgi:hypothetical protein
MNSRVVTLAAWGLVVAAPWTKLREKLRESPVYGLGAVGSLALAMLYMSDASFSPFIYFQF